jgi:hypothetical protein
MIENSKKKLFSDSCMLCNLLFGEIKKFEFSLFCKNSLKNGKTAITFAYDVGKKTYNISKKSWEKVTSGFTRVYPVSQFLDSQNSK